MRSHLRRKQTMKLTRQLIRKVQAKYPHEDVDSEGSWAISYGDMVTLLLTFFIIFFSIHPTQGTSENTKVDRLTIALIKALRAERSTDFYAATPAGAVDSRKQISLADENSQEHGISEKILQDIKGKAHIKGQEIIVEFPEISFFDFSQIELKANGEMALRDFAKVFLPYMGHFKVGIRAYTDTRKVRADSSQRYKDNLELSALRGIAAIRVLQKSGLPLEQLKVGGYGELRTTARNLAAVTVNESKEEKLKSLSLSRKIVLVIEPQTNEIEFPGGPKDVKK